MHGRLAQLEEHLLDVQGVRGSSPLASTKKKPLLSTKTREAFSMISDYVKTDDAVNVKASPFHMTCFYNGICTFLKQYMAEKASDSYGVCRVKSVSRKRFCALIASVFFSFATFF